MRRPSERSIIGAVLLFLLGAGAVLLILGFEREQYRRYTGYSGKAKSNPYLAAQSLLEERGFTVRTIHSPQRLSELSPQVTTLFLFDRSEEGNERQLAAVLRWIKEGGRSVCLLDGKDKPVKGTAPAEKKHSSLSRRVLSSAGAIVHTSGHKEDNEPSVDLDYSYGFYSDDKATVLWSYPAGDRQHAAAFAYGRGKVVGLGDLRFARNSNIGEKKNLELFWSITAAEGPPGTQRAEEKAASATNGSEAREIWFYKSRGLPSLWRIMFREGWMVLLTLSLCAAIAIWIYAPRFGPVLPDRDEKEGDFSHYIAAVGRFFSKRGKTELLFRDMRSAALENVERRISGFSRRSIEEQTELLSGLTAQSRESIRFFLTTDGSLGEEDFRRYIIIAERIRTWKRDSMKRR